MAELSEAELEELEQRAKRKLETTDPNDSWCYIDVGPDDILNLITELRDLRRQNADNAEWRKEFKSQRDSLIDVINQMQKQVKNA